MDTQDEDDLILLEWEDDTSLLVDGSISNPNSQFSAKGEAFYKQIDEDLDYAFALSLQTQYDEEVKENTVTNSKISTVNNAESSKPLSIVDEQWELLDPHPDIHALFTEYDTKFFYGKLKGVEVRWSPRMTLCAGVCSYEGRGGLCSIRLSVPLLKLRPRRDLVETLLHEMIHAYLFVTHNNKDREGHGPEFLSHMNRINKESGTRITVYHSFHGEVDLYRQHWWKCGGPCRNRQPFYGLVKRAMNRAPGPNDNWWADHQASCGGTFKKIREPDNYGKKKVTKRKIPTVTESKGSHSDIRNFLKNDILTNSYNNGSNSKSSVSKTSSNSKPSVSTISNSSKPPVSKSSINNPKTPVYKSSINNPKTPVSKASSNSEASVSKASSIFDLKSLLSKEDNVVTVNNSRTPKKENFIPFQGKGQKLGSSSEIVSVPSYFVKKDNILNSVNNNSPLLTNSSGKILGVTGTSKTSKIPRLTNSSDARNVYKDQSPCTSRTMPDNSASNLIQNPIERFFPSTNEPSTSRHGQKDNNIAISTVEKDESSKVSCPVCFITVKEQEINSHLDICLMRS